MNAWSALIYAQNNAVNTIPYEQSGYKKKTDSNRNDLIMIHLIEFGN